MERLFELENVARGMIARGITPEELGTHSTRKGAATYVCAGSTAGPNFHPVALRASWPMPVVQATYTKYDQAGDQYVGRTVCGLDVQYVGYPRERMNLLLFLHFLMVVEIVSLQLLLNIFQIFVHLQ
jgi:hypothetical protein